MLMHSQLSSWSACHRLYIYSSMQHAFLRTSKCPWVQYWACCAAVKGAAAVLLNVCLSCLCLFAGVTRKQRHEDTQIVDYVSDAVIKQQQKSLVEQLSYGPCTGNRTGTGTPSDYLSAGCCRSQPGRDTFNNQSAALAVGCNGKPMISLHHSQ